MTGLRRDNFFIYMYKPKAYLQGLEHDLFSVFGCGSSGETTPRLLSEPESATSFMIHLQRRTVPVDFSHEHEWANGRLPELLSRVLRRHHPNFSQSTYTSLATSL